jgi:cytochrome b pre-mRNA-processing protein 3
LSFLARLFGRRDDLAAYRPLYAGVVARARDPIWYRDGRVPDTIDGRFDMVAAVLALVLLRLEGEGDAGREPAARLTEGVVQDLEGQMRQLGFGDVVVGKHVGGLMGALGGRLTAFRAALAGAQSIEEVAARNIYRGELPEDARLALVAARLRETAATLAALPVDVILAGKVS